MMALHFEKITLAKYSGGSKVLSANREKAVAEQRNDGSLMKSQFNGSSAQ